LVVNGSDDLYCTGCGTELTRQDEASPRGQTQQAAEWETPHDRADTLLLPPLHPSVAVEPETEIRSKGPTRLRLPHWLGLAAVLLVIAGAVAFAVLWRVEVGHNHRLAGRLATATSGLASARKQLAGTEAQLKATTAVSQKRRAVLLRAQAVLARVDTLLSSVDELQKRTSDIQGGRDIFSSASDTLINDMITLGNYVIQTDPTYIDSTYEQQLIDTANADLANVRSDQASLGGYDASYGAASTRFGHRADAFTQAVRKLQQQLQSVASK